VARRMWNRALVTGASSGIGEAIARRLAAEGTDLVLVARNTVRLGEVADGLRARHAVDVDVLVADLADPVQLAAVEHRLADTVEPVDLLVNNAGLGFSGRFGDIAVDAEEAVMRVNVMAVVRLSHAALGRMRAGPSPVGRHRPVGGILLVSSLQSFEPAPMAATYAAGKAFVTSFGQALHEEARSDGIVVTTVCPGLTRTGFQARADFDVSRTAGWMWQSPETVAAVAVAGVSRRRAVVVPGVGNKSVQVAFRVLPLGLARRVIGLATLGGRP
jgi:short-subunit dehydrogenase